MSAVVKVEGWDSIRIEECCDILDSRRIPLSSSVRNDMQGNIPYYGANGLLDHIDNYIFDEPLILVAEDGGHFSEYQHRTVAYKIEGKSWVNNHAHILRPKKDIVFDWVFYQLEHKNIVPFINGSTRDKLNQLDLRGIVIPVPSSSNEQHVISKVIKAIDNAILIAKNSLENIKKLHISLVQNILTGRFRLDGSVRLASEMFSHKKCGMVPTSWEVKKVKQRVSDCQYGLNLSASEDGDVPMFRMNNIIDGKMVDSPMVSVKLSQKDFEKYRVEKGDILFNRTNSMDLVGKVGIFDLEEDYVFASYLIRLRANDENCPRFLNYYLNSYRGQTSLRSKATPAVSQANINAKSLVQTYVPAPKDKGEQEEIAAMLDEVDQLKQEKLNKIEALKRLKKSLMQNLLTGKVRVDVDKVNAILKEAS